ncbi:MAG: UDP-N-acetylglucosamine 1-carboxyvinyltransferase, partial [Clostridiales bacterium]|nr:UDP-N-acetylglucosamine 1-carboxyvinyltransferase [Clostridiales bacterium]
MDSYHIEGGYPLKGETLPKGAKNAALPILAAAAAVGDVCRITNCPRLSDVNAMFSILRALGCTVSEDGDGILVDSRNLLSGEIPGNLMKEMRSSVFLMGPLLSRLGSVSLSSPGGCEIGRRPIDIHLQGLSCLGAKIREDGDRIHCTGRLKGTVIRLSFPSVGATENLMMAALGAEGCTRILNAAKEPEILDLQNFLNACGAEIQGAGTGEISVRGGLPLHGAEYRILPDRIEAGTMLAAAAATGGEILLRGIDSSLLKSPLDI